jgi:hypothetical protein
MPKREVADKILDKVAQLLSLTSQPPEPTRETLEHILNTGEINYSRFRILKDETSFFPKPGQEFQVKADGDTYTTKLSSDKPPRMRSLKPWFDKNKHIDPELEAGNKVVFKRLGLKLYQLTRA